MLTSHSDFTLSPGVLRVITRLALTPASIAALEASNFGPFKVTTCVSRDELARHWTDADGAAILLTEDDASDARLLATHTLQETVILVVVAAIEPATVLSWLQRGAQDVLLFEEIAAASMPQRLRAAIERKRLERKAIKSYATDLNTGLPHQQQLIEHMSQLIALREREPSPMAMLVLRVEGLATTQTRLGTGAASVLRRKVAVRLRSGVRASDVVAFLGDDCFAVLLGTLLAPADAARVGAKLLSAMLRPFTVSGNEIGLAVALGIAQYPEDGTQPDGLLRCAAGLAASAPAQGRIGSGHFHETGDIAKQAANDD